MEEGDESTRSDSDPHELARSWRAPQWSIGGRRSGPPPLQRWEAVLRAERTVAHRLVALAARRPLLRRVLRLPSHLGRPPGPSLEEREQRVAEASFLPGSRNPSKDHGSIPDRVGPGRRPAPGPLLDHEIDAALVLLASMPFEEIQDRGWHLQPRSFAWPLNDVRFLRDNPELWMRHRAPPGIEWDLDAQEELARRLARYAPELSDVPTGLPTGAAEFSWHNGVFSGADAYFYYGLVRELRPRRVIEVGSGWSTLLLGRALSANSEPARVTLIEPSPSEVLLAGLQPDWDLQTELVQLVDLEVFDGLRTSDILFYDGSHSVRTAGDLNWMLFEVLPRLAAGVWIHFHDIFWPGDYPPKWILDEGLSWNEQYMLQAFLMHNDSYRLRLATHMLSSERGEALAPLFPVGFRGGSVWIEKVA